MKQVSKRIMEIMNDPIVQVIVGQQRSLDLDEIIEKVSGFWKFDMYSKNPTPPYFNKEGKFVPTDLPLADVLYSMIGAVIKLPYYKSMRETKIKEGQKRLSEERFGKITGLYSNAETLTSGLSMFDMSVTTSREVGDWRKFTLVDFKGEWYDGWKCIEIMPTAEENKFLTESELWTQNRVIFKNFVHPLRWTSVYGKAYFTTKLLIDRLTEDAKFMNGIIEKCLAAGINFPEGEKKVWADTESLGDKKSIKVPAFKIEIDMPKPEGVYTEPPLTQETLVEFDRKRNSYIYSVKPKLQFAVRASELAFYKHIKSQGWNSFPAWIKDAEWETGYRKKGGRTDFNRFVWFQPSEKDEKGQWQRGVAFLARDWEKAERVSTDYEL